METNSSSESVKKTTLEDLSKEELVKRCERLLLLAQKAKQAKDIVQEENNELKAKLTSKENDSATNEIIESLTRQKLQLVTKLEELQNQNKLLSNNLQSCEDKCNGLDSENVSFKRQVKRLTDENEQLISDLEALEKQMHECKRLGTEQQNQLLVLEEANRKLENEGTVVLKEKMEMMKINLAEKDKNIVTISEELQSKITEIQGLQAQVVELNAFKETTVKELETDTEKLRERLKIYHGKIIKLAGNVKAVKESKNEIVVLFKTYTNQVDEWKKQLNLTSQKLFQYISHITAENQELLKQNDSLKENNAKFLEQLEAHKTDDEKSKEINELELTKAENKKLSTENARLLDLHEENKVYIENLLVEKDEINRKLLELVDKHVEEMRVCNDQNSNEIQSKMEENEKICIEYRKVISKLEENVEMTVRQLDELKQNNFSLQEMLKEKQTADDKTHEEILKLVQENAELNRKLQEQAAVSDQGSQTKELEESIVSLKRENSELLAEMNEMNQALKERGETISKFQSHCEEVMKKLQIYETQANKNVDNISQKEETIKQLQQEVQKLKNQPTESSDKEQEIAELKSEIEALKERINMDSSYAESETMSTSTISRTEDSNRMKDLEGSWEERYGKLRTLAIKLKGKVRDLTNELLKEQTEKNEIQQKCASSIKTISTLQGQCDELQDQLEASKKQIKECTITLDKSAAEMSRDKQEITQHEELIARLKKEIDELNQEKITTETWKKQIGAKVQTFRKELDANKVLKKEYEAKIAKLTADLEAKEQALKAESVGHQQTKSSLEHSNNERMKNSVLNLEMQDYERSVKELSQKLDKKHEEICSLKSQIESQKSTSNALREQNKILEERCVELNESLNATQIEITAYKKQLSDLEESVVQKDNKIHDLTQVLESVRLENEELSTELSKLIAEHQKHAALLKSEKENFRGQVLGLQQSLRDAQDSLKLKEDELKILQSDYENYKVRAQSVLRQNQNRDVGLEEKISEELSRLKLRCQTLSSELEEHRVVGEQLKKENSVLLQEKKELVGKYDEVSGEIEDLKSLYEQLSNKYQQTVMEHGETVRSLKVHAETLAQCYRQQLSEQEVRHNREIIELQSKIEKAPTPTEMSLAPVTMQREEGEGSENTESAKNVYPVPLERLLGSESDQEIAFVKKQLSEEESKVIHLTALLADTEQDLAKHMQMNKLLKEEIRRQQRSVEREKHAENLEYLKNVVFKFITLHNGDERSRLVPVLNTILKLSPEETQKLNMVARGEPGLRGWTNYLWSPKSS